MQQSGTDSTSGADLMLPTDCPVAVLIPPIVDLVLNRPDGSPAATDPLHWRLGRVGGGLLDGSMTLQENAVQDGELILLTSERPPAPRSRPCDPSDIVAETTDPATSGALQGAVTAAGIAVATVSAVALAWAGATAGASTHLWTAALLSAASATGAVVVRPGANRPSATLSLAAIVFAMTTGFLAAPNAPWAPALLLAASSGFAVSILMLHVEGADTTMVTAFSATTGVITPVCLIGVASRLPVGAAGAVLTVLSLAGLSAAPKLTVLVAGLGPSLSTIGDRRAIRAHDLLTGLVAGWSSSAAFGVAVVAVVGVVGDPGLGPPEPIPVAPAAIFAADVGLLLLLRQRAHIDRRRRVWLGGAGLCAVMASYIVALRAGPEHAFLLCAAMVAASTTAVAWAAKFAPPTPVVRQGLQILECLALAAVVPLAAWVAGVYGLVRDLSLL